MNCTVDLHSHSGYSGGVGQVDLPGIAQTMQSKGIDVFGSGDCLQETWLATLENVFTKKHQGLFTIDGSEKLFLLQTEVIFTADVPSGGRKCVHTVLLFPDFKSIKATRKLLARWEVKLGIGRPFIKCSDADDVAEKLFALTKIDERIFVIPAHVLTPQGIYGSNNPVDSMKEFFGDFAAKITAVETGLSADPQVLSLIPELDNIALISNSDCHSAALNRVGREYTSLQIDKYSYDEIISAISSRKINYTAEFTPAEGRFFLTGHRAGKRGHKDGQHCFFSPDKVPESAICPICGKMLTVGVLDRALHLSCVQGAGRTLETTKPRQDSFHMIPLIEVIAAGFGVKSITSKKVSKVFYEIIAEVETEERLWRMPVSDIEKKLKDIVPEQILLAILAVKAEDFTFYPLGYDGEYGEIKIGEQAQWFGHSVIHGKNIPDRLF